MIWIILPMISIILLVYSFKKDKFGLGFVSFLSSIGSIIILITCIVSGVTTYPYLIGKYQEIKALHQRIEDIRAAAYPEQPEPGKLIAGSLTNLQQSSRLSEYLRLVATNEAEYNADLTKARFYKTDLTWILFGHGLFISNKVFQLPEIKHE